MMNGAAVPQYQNTIAAHNRLVSSAHRYAAKYANATSATSPDSCDVHTCMTTAYTGLVEMEPGVLLLAYDRRHGADTWPVGHKNEIWSMRIQIKTDDASVRRWPTAQAVVAYNKFFTPYPKPWPPYPSVDFAMGFRFKIETILLNEVM